MFALLALVSPVWAVDHAVSTSVLIIDCDTFNGGVSAGDRLVLAGGTHVLNTVQDCDQGTLGNEIQFINDPTDSSPARINLTKGGLDAFEFKDVENFIVDGTGGWVGVPSGQCGVDPTDKSEGRTQCGIRFIYTSNEPTHLVRTSGSTKNFTMKGFEIDGTGYPRSGIGTGLMINDRFYKNDNNNQTENGWNIVEWRENFTIDQFWIHDTFHSGIYAGPNFGKSSSVDDLPLRNIVIKNGIIEDIGWNGAQIKTAVEGTNAFTNIHVYRAGLEAAAIPDSGHSACLNVNDVTNMTFDRVKVHTCGGDGLICRTLNFYDAAQGITYPFTCTIQNSLVIDAAEVLDRSGIHIQRKFTTVPDWDIIVRNTTVVSGGKVGVDADPQNGSTINSVKWIENIICDHSVADIADDGFTETNNNTGACSDENFKNYGARDLHLTSTSPAVNAGTESGFPTEDFDGISRPQGANHDIGGYELGGSTPPPLAECEDGIDNDSDTFIDYPADSGCGSLQDDDESDDPDPPGDGSITGKPVTYTSDTSEALFADHCYIIDESSGTNLNDYCADELSQTAYDLTITGADWELDSLHTDRLAFVKANSDYAENTGISLTSTQVVCLLIRIVSTEQGDTFFAFVDKDVGDKKFTQQLTGGGFTQLGRENGGSFTTNNGPDVLEDNKWHWYCIKVSDTQSDISVDGGGWDESNTAHTGLIAVLDTFGLGQRRDSTPSKPADFELASVFWWDNNDLTDANMTTIWNTGNIWPILGIDADSGGEGPTPNPQEGDYGNVAT